MKYQDNYAAGRPQMYDKKSREEKAKRMVILLGKYFDKEKLKKLTLLDVGASTGIIGNYLAQYFRSVTVADIDKQAIEFAGKEFKKKNLSFKVDDAMNLSFKDNTFDIVICTHVYEHVPNPRKLFSEIYRVLKPNGVCYLAAINSLWPMEPHYDLPFLSYLPKRIANTYVRLFNKANEYYETPANWWQLKKLTNKFVVNEYTAKIFQNPANYGYLNIPKALYPVSFLLSPLLKFLAPTFFWLLIKK
ncbi:MAG: class I SAM-dependent methyltransferase [Patescibacteria group bacterium]